MYSSKASTSTNRRTQSRVTLAALAALADAARVALNSLADAGLIILADAALADAPAAGNAPAAGSAPAAGAAPAASNAPVAGAAPVAGNAPTADDTQASRNERLRNMERYGNFIVNPAPISGTLFRRGVILGPPTHPRPTVILALALKTQEDAIRFAMREASVYALLRSRPHPHVARVVADHVITTAGRPTGRLVVLPAAEGTNLATVLAARGPMPIPLACRTLVQILAAVAHCHMYGIILRKISTSKIFFADAQRRTAVLADLLGSQMVVRNPNHPGRAWVTDMEGDPAYVAPEVLRNEGYDAAAADVYSLGVVFFAALTGRLPFVADTPAALGRLITAGHVDWPVGIPPPVLELLMRMMSRDPGARPTAASIVALPSLAVLVNGMGVPLPGQPMSAVA